MHKERQDLQELKEILVKPEHKDHQDLVHKVIREQQEHKVIREQQEHKDP